MKHLEILSAVALASVSISTLADSLTDSNYYVLQPSEQLNAPITWEHLSDKKIELQLNSALTDVRLVVSTEGKISVHWKAPDLPAEEYAITVNAIDLISRELVETQTLKVKIQAPEPPELGPFAPQKLIAGVDWTFPLEVKHIASDQLELLASGMPAAAELKIDNKGRFYLSWTPKEHQLGLHEIRLKALDRLDILHSVERTLSMFVVPGKKQLANQVELAASFEPIANQVISAGRILSLAVSATTNDEALAVVQIDRLPPNASFDVNSDGSRTFYWQTSDKDQGEHVFRFTAFHPDNRDNKVSQEVLIIVGDPTRNTSLPVVNEQ